ncbi:Down syndrome cell adhesion molecule-like protein Dscam2 [Blattella germanica]|nr:Down syndrome cell adhesion molecule-like protein Dscam2 [Blattella germanica]
MTTWCDRLVCGVAGFDSHLRGPSFLLEPPPKLEFSNSSGGWLDCSASGSPPPTIDWLSVDGSPVGDVHGVRRVLRNGTLILLPFPPAAYRQDIHSTVYRCVASNAVGRIISRDVQVRAGTPPNHTPVYAVAESYTSTQPRKLLVALWVNNQLTPYLRADVVRL